MAATPGGGTWRLLGADGWVWWRVCGAMEGWVVMRGDLSGLLQIRLDVAPGVGLSAGCGPRRPGAGLAHPVRLVYSVYMVRFIRFFSLYGINTSINMV